MAPEVGPGGRLQQRFIFDILGESVNPIQRPWVAWLIALGNRSPHRPGIAGLIADRGDNVRTATPRAGGFAAGDQNMAAGQSVTAAPYER